MLKSILSWTGLWLFAELLDRELWKILKGDKKSGIIKCKLDLIEIASNKTFRIVALITAHDAPLFPFEFRINHRNNPSTPFSFMSIASPDRGNVLMNLTGVNIYAELYIESSIRLNNIIDRVESFIQSDVCQNLMDFSGDINSMNHGIRIVKDKYRYY